MEKRKTRVIVTSSFLEDVVVATTSQYPNESWGVLDGTSNTLVSSNKVNYRDIVLERIIPYENLKRKKMYVELLSNSEYQKNIILHNRGRFRGTYHSHVYVSEKIPDKPELTLDPKENPSGASDILSIKDIYQDLEKSSDKKPLEDYLELLISIRKILSKNSLNKQKFDCREFPLIRFYKTSSWGFEGKVDCFYFNGEDLRKPFKKIKLQRIVLFLLN